MITAASDSEMLIALLAAGGILAVLSWRLIVWVREAPTTPDPWDAETDKKLTEPETEQTCPHCSTPQKDDAWFCPHCGCAVGPYNNMMPFIQIFSEGEVFRNGVNQRFRNRLLVGTGYTVIVICAITTLLFASWPLCLVSLIPLYYLSTVFRNLSTVQKQEQD